MPQGRVHPLLLPTKTGEAYPRPSGATARLPQLTGLSSFAAGSLMVEAKAGPGAARSQRTAFFLPQRVAAHTDQLPFAA